MTQSNLNVANQNFPNFRADLNAELRALATLSMGDTAPSVTFEGMWWFDSANNLLRVRNKDNTGWVTMFDMSTGSFRGNVLLGTGSAGAPALAFIDSTKTGIFRAGADVLGITAGDSGMVVRVAAEQVRIFKELFADVQIRSAVGFRAPGDDGVSKPGYSWDGNTNTGMYRLGNNAIGFSVDGTRKLSMDADRVVIDASQFRAPAGTLAQPGIAIGGTTVGFRLDSGNNLILTRAGVDVLSIRAGLIRAEGSAKFDGDGSGLSTLNANAVLTVLAAAALGAAGTFAFLTRTVGTDGFSAGSVHDGASLRYAGLLADGTVQFGANSPPGSWMALGYSGAGTRPTTLFKRV